MKPKKDNTPKPQEDKPAEDTFKVVEKPPEEASYYTAEGDRVLAYAWELYETYSNGSGTQKKQNAKIRQLIIILIFLTSTLAVFNTLPGMDFVAGLVGGGLSYLPDVFSRWYGLFGSLTLSAILVVLSVATSAMLSYASQFTPMKAWIMYRVGADRIRSEIYLYRMLAGRYKGMEPGSQEIRKEFLEQIEGINQQIYELETAPPFLQTLEAGKVTRRSPSLPRRLAWWAGAPFRWLTIPFKQLSKLWSDRGRSSGSGGRKRLSGRYYPEKDNGFNQLKGKDYLQYRAVPQRDWYVMRVDEDYAKIKDYRTVLLTIGGASAVLAAIRLEPYIVITTAAAVAINTHIQLNLIGSTYGNYHVTASRLDSEIVRWQNLENPEAPENVSSFVENVERILEEERVIWMQQASQAQKETEQNLIKGAGKREGLPSIDYGKYLGDNGTTRTTPTPETETTTTPTTNGSSTSPQPDSASTRKPAGGHPSQTDKPGKDS